MTELPPGYQPYEYDDPFEDLVGPFGYRIEDGAISFAFLAGSQHCNTGDTLHGGILMTFADFALCLAATWDQPGERCVTVSFNCEFVAAAIPGDVVESTCEVVERMRSLTFVRGTLSVGTRVVLSFSGIVKRLPGRR